MKIFYRHRLVDITGFHQVLVAEPKLTISYPRLPSGARQEPDEFAFSFSGTAKKVADQIVVYGHTDFTLEVAESDGKCATWVRMLNEYEQS